MAGDLALKAIMNTIYYSGGASLANPLLRGIGSILMLHRVNPDNVSAFAPNAGLTITPAFLESVCSKLRSTIFRFVSMDAAAEIISASQENGQVSRPFVAITLDDGYRDNLEYAVPIFRKYDIPFTIYVAPGLVDGRATLWWEDLERIIAKRDRIDIDLPGGHVEFDLRGTKAKLQAYQDLMNYFSGTVDETEQRRIMRELCWMYGVDAEAHRAGSIMNWEEISDLARDPLCTIGAHTINHFAVARLKEKTARFEISESARLIKIETGKDPRHFAFPYGGEAAAGTRDFAIAAASGFRTAVTTRHGVCYPVHREHMHALPRISLNGKFQRFPYVKTLLSGATSRMANRGRKLNVG